MSTQPKENDVLKELQKTTKYLDQSYKVIKTAKLREELKRLQTASAADPSQVLSDDNLKEIMLNSDLKTIKNFCQVNKLANKLCNDLSFWNQKLALEGNIPIIFNDLRTFDEIKEVIVQQTDEYDTNNLNIVLYSLMKHSKRDAELALMVNKVEKNSKYLSTKGTIALDVINKLPALETIKYYYVLPEIVKLKIKEFEDTIYLADVIIDYMTIKLQKDEYHLIIKFTNKNFKRVDVVIDKSDALRLLTLYLFDKYTYRDEDNSLKDSDGYLFEYVKDGDYDENTAYFGKKQGIYETLIQLHIKII